MSSTLAGEDVRRALIGWPRCPKCGRWMSDGQTRGVAGKRIPAWLCNHKGHKVRWTARWGWQRWHARGDRFWGILDPGCDPSTPLLVPGRDQLELV